MHTQNTDFDCKFYLRTSKPKSNGQLPIYARLRVNSSIKHKSTGLSISMDQWNEKTQSAHYRCAIAEEINTSLHTLKERYQNSALTVKVNKRNFNIDHVLNEFSGKKEVRGLVEFFELRLARIESLIGTKYSKGTFVNYRTTLKHLKHFLQSKIKTKDILLGEIGVSMLEDLLEFIQLECKCQQNTANKYMRALRAVLYEAKKRELIVKNPFESFSLKYNQTERPILTEHELDLLINTSFQNQRIENTRKIFLLACLTGLAYADIRDLQGKHLIQQGDQWLIIKPRVKSAVKSYIPLSQSAIAILESYQPGATPINTIPPPLTHPLVATPSNQKLNAYLKEIADLCGIQKNLTFHCARHTFATTVALSNGVPIESVSKMLGHTSIKTTQIYAKVLESKLVKDMEGVFGKY